MENYDDGVQFDISPGILLSSLSACNCDRIGVYTEPVSSPVHHYDKRLLSW